MAQTLPERTSKAPEYHSKTSTQIGWQPEDTIYQTQYNFFELNLKQN